MRFSMPERCEDGETKKEAVCVGEDGHDADEKVHWSVFHRLSLFLC